MGICLFSTSCTPTPEAIVANRTVGVSVQVLQSRPPTSRSSAGGTDSITTAVTPACAAAGLTFAQLTEPPDCRSYVSGDRVDAASAACPYCDESNRKCVAVLTISQRPLKRTLHFRTTLPDPLKLRQRRTSPSNFPPHASTRCIVHPAENRATLKPVLRLALPVVAEQFLSMLVGFSDTMLTGWYLTAIIWRP